MSDLVTGFVSTSRYSWGAPNDPTEKDPQEDDEEKARQGASMASKPKSAFGPAPVIALWNNATGEIVGLYFDGQEFLP